jgi:signal transduction histidine kinase
VKVEIESDCRLQEEVQVTFYRVAQEALHNIIKHAQATEVKMGLVCDERNVTLTICDKGRGFEGNGSVATGMGLQIMRERVRAIRSELRIDSSPHGGTTVEAQWAREAGRSTQHEFKVGSNSRPERR